MKVVKGDQTLNLSYFLSELACHILLLKEVMLCASWPQKARSPRMSKKVLLGPFDFLF
jgi:hypothetical protein